MNTYAFVIGEKNKEFTCIADANVHSKNASTNYGNESHLFISSLKSMDLYAFAYISFNVTGIPRDAVISEVKIKLNIINIIVDATVIIGIWECNAFEEYSITWDSIKNLDISDYNLVCSVELSTTGIRGFTLNDEGYAEQEPHHVLGNGTYYFMLTDLSILISSKETSYPPQLIVSFYKQGEVIIIPDFLFIAIPITIVASIILYNFYSRKKKISHYNKYGNQKIVKDLIKTQIYCIECGKPRIEEEPLCSSCGFNFLLLEKKTNQGKDDVDGEIQEKILCPTCSNEIWAGAVNCSHCNSSFIKKPQNGKELIEYNKITALTSQIKNILESKNQTNHELVKWHIWFIDQRNRFINGNTTKKTFLMQLKEYKRFLESED